MKSYFLEKIESLELLREVLDTLMPEQREPWVIMHAPLDAIAYFNVIDGNGVQADISGRHFNRDDDVLSVLRALRERVGGVVLDDCDEIISD